MISFIVATIGRRSLAHTLASIELWPGDEVIVIGNVPTRTDGPFRYITSPPGDDWGSTERNVAMPLARGKYQAHIDDDDVYVPGARKLMAKAIENAPNAVTIFRMQYPNGTQLWVDPVIRWGNVGTPMLFLPNDRTKLGQWGEKRDCGDLHFMQTMKWLEPHDIVWSTDVTTLVSAPHK